MKAAYHSGKLNRPMRLSLLFIPLILILSCEPDARNTTQISGFDYLRDFEPITETGFVNIVIEIPAGSNQKWEVEKESGYLEWEIREDSLRVVNYLPYPANYGMIPRTWLPADKGGDDDPLDIFLIGPKQERGAVVQGRIVGVIKMLDGGEQDDKLIAVDPDSWFWNVHTLDDLNIQFPGISEILSIWLRSYKGGTIVTIQGIEDEIEAEKILHRAIESFPPVTSN